MEKSRSPSWEERSEKAGTIGCSTSAASAGGETRRRRAGWVLLCRHVIVYFTSNAIIRCVRVFDQALAPCRCDTKAIRTFVERSRPLSWNDVFDGKFKRLSSACGLQW